MPQAPTLSGIEIRPRDIDLLRGLFESRIMGLRHLAPLYFDGRESAAQKRLQKLQNARLVGQRPRKPFEEGIYFLTQKARKLLEAEGALQRYPKLGEKSFEKRARVSDHTARHELEVMDVKLSITTGIQSLPSFEVAQFSTWPLLYQFYAQRPSDDGWHGSLGTRVMVKPDGFLRVHEHANGKRFVHAFFLELDRSSETQQRLAHRAACYNYYYRSGGFAAWNGARCERFEQFPFRVIVILKNAERRNNTAERLLLQQPPILSQVWLTTFEEITSNPLGPIWIRPRDYRDVTRDTEFDPEHRRNLTTYRREPEREAMVEASVPKLRLLE